jgi:DsbC/DsbD-like thiol-disulfide interchange protein
MTVIRLVVAVFSLYALAGGGASVARATPPSGVSTPWVPLHASRVRLVAGPHLERSGGRVAAGLELTLEDGWKTYWRMPGDAGVPPAFDWSKSTNVASINILYPAPIRLSEPAAETVGYKGSVIFPIEFTAKDPTHAVNLKLDLELGICRDICIPASTTLVLEVPPATAAGAPLPALSDAFDRVPRGGADRRPSDPLLTNVTAKLDGTAPGILIEAKFPREDKTSDVFIEAPDGIYVPLPKKLPAATDGTARFEVDLSRGGNAQELKNKVLTLTLVSSGGASEFTWRVP